MRTTHAIGVAVLSVWAGVGLAAAQEAKPLAIRQRSGPMWPWQDLRRRGLPVADLPEADNAAWRYIEAINACEIPSGPVGDAFDQAMRGSWPGGQSGKQLAAFMQANEKALETARKASSMATCQLPYLGRPDQPLIELNAAALPGIRYLMQLMTIRAHQLVATGQIDAALGEAMAAMRVAAHVGQGVTLVDGMVAGGGLQNEVVLVRELVTRYRPSEAAMAKALAELNAPACPWPTMLRVVQSDRATWQDALARMFDRPEWLSLLWNASPSEPGPDANWGRLYRGLARATLPDRLAATSMAEMYDLLALRASQSALQAAWVHPYRHKLLVANVPLWNVPARRRVAALSAMAGGFDRAVCELQMTRIIVALQLHRARTGAFPEALSAIAVDLGGQVPKDPYSDKDFVYTREGDGWVLYGVGENYADDGGQLGPNGENFVVDVVLRYQPPAKRSTPTAPTSLPAKPKP